MSSGGGGTQTVTQDIPSWMQGYISQNYAKGQQVGNTPLTPYTGQGVAPWNSQEQAGANTINNAANGQTGMGALNTGVQNATAAGQYSPNQVGYQAPTASDINQYLNPYTQDVVNTTNQQIQEQGNIANQQTAGSATSAGAYGGSRMGVQTALNNQYTGMTMANTDANLESQGYNTALGQASTNAGANLNASEANQNAGLTANQQQLQSGVDLGALGQGQASTALGYGNAQAGIGQAQQQTTNAQDQFNYGQYYNGIMWPYQQLQAQEGATYGGNVGGSSSQPIYQNNLGSAIGTGLAGAGIASALGASGAGAGLAGGGLGLLSLLSDPQAKTDRANVDENEILDKISTMPVDTWRYKPGIGMGSGMHIGPMATDFAERFGGDGHSIPVIDALGTNMAAIKALSNKVNRLERR